MSDALAPCSLIPAKILVDHVPQMEQEGRLPVGCDADVLVFDLETIQDHGTFVEPAQPASDQRHAVVNGVPIIEEGKRLGDARPGRPVRRTV